MTKITKQQAEAILARYPDPEMQKELKKRIRATNTERPNFFRCDRAIRIQKAFVELKRLNASDLKATKKRLKQFVKNYRTGKTWYPYISKMPGKLDGMDFTIIVAAMQWL